MKNYLLAICALLLSASVNAQHLALLEDFSGELCGACRSFEPDLLKLVGAPGNASKLLIITYETSIPIPGLLYFRNSVVPDNRRLYYGVNAAPTLLFDGALSSPDSAKPGHPLYFSQAEIDRHAAAASPFAMTVTHSWNSAMDSVIANVTITATSAYIASSNHKLRVALIEDIKFCSNPNITIAEDTFVTFPHVVQAMFPNVNGTAIPNTWTKGQSLSFSVRGKVPAFANKLNPGIYLAVWIQDDATKAVKQAARSGIISIPTIFDAGIVDCPTDKLMCSGNSSQISINNTGTTGMLTSAKIYSRIDNGPYNPTPVNWTGSLAPGGSATVTIPAQAAITGKHYRIDSLVLPNGSADKNEGNNTRIARMDVANTAPVSLPYHQDCAMGYFIEIPKDWMYHDFNGNKYIWRGGRIDHGSNNVNNLVSFATTSGTDAYLIIPTPAMAPSRVLEFWQAYAQYSSSNTDKLEVSYSTDCGLNWKSIWSASGAGLVTTTANYQYWWPTDGADTSSEWKLRSVSLNSVPANALLAFHGIAGGGIALLIDDVTMRTGTVGISGTSLMNDLKTYPNPAHTSATLEFTLNRQSNVSVTLSDLTGRRLKTISDGLLKIGQQRLTFSVDEFPVGMYLLTLQTEEGSVTKKLSVCH